MVAGEQPCELGERERERCGPVVSVHWVPSDWGVDGSPDRWDWWKVGKGWIEWGFER